MNLFRAASLISGLSLLSRITGLMRDAMVAALFGASTLTDAYQVAFRIPNLLRRLFAEGAFSQAFVPVLAASRARDGDEATHSLIDAVATVLSWALVAISVAGVIGAPVLVWLLGAGLPAEGFDAAVVMTRWMFPYIGCMSLVALSAGILNTWRHFAVPAFTPVLLNVATIAVTLLLAPHLKTWGYEPIYAMAIGTMVGGLLQLLIQLPALLRLGLLPRLKPLREAWRHPGVHRVLTQMAPALLGVGVAQLSLLINTQVAIYIGPGMATSLGYADRLMEFPSALLGVALGSALTPSLSAAQAKGDGQRYSELLDWGLRLILLLGLPCAVALLAFAGPMVATLFQRGAFHAGDVQNTGHAVMAYGVGLLGILAVKVLAPGFYARQDTRTPVRIAVRVLLLTQLMNLAFVPLLGGPGLSLSIGLGATLNAAMLLAGLRRLGSYTPLPGWWPFGLRVTLASAVMGTLQWWMGGHVDWIVHGHGEGRRALILAGCLAASAAVYFAVLLVSGTKLRQLLKRG
ncbi:MAG: murein biosynthesis integral membrane protein MurJ [Paucibacter sp.]|nr:murein biosynthesis integral membrane protein MurJ [Roseateles sp.]